MDVKTSAKPEAPPSGEDLPNEKALNMSDLVTNIKLETAINDNEFEVDNKRNIKVKANVDKNLQNETQNFYTILEGEFNNDMTTLTNQDFEMDSKVAIKQEPVSGTELANVEYLDCTSLAAINGKDFKMKIECRMDPVVCSDRDVETLIKTELDCQSQIKENKESDLETAEDLLTSESPSCITEYESSHTFPCASDFKIASEKNVDKETSLRGNIHLLNCDPVCDSKHYETQENVTDKIICDNISCQQILHSHSSSQSQQQKSYIYEVCEQDLLQNSSLKRHTLFHSDTKSYKCEHCDKYFTQKSNLNIHTSVHSSKKPYKCEHCAKCYKYKSNLKAHNLYHTAAKPFKCEQCDMCFKWRSQFKRHALLHLGIGPYKCEHCEKCFSQQSYLKSHTLVHSGTKPYKCEHCDKCFSRKADLKSHTLFHSTTKPYKCEQCNMCFTWRVQFKRHASLHSGVKPYNCEHCEKCFSQKSSLKSHILVHSSTKPFKCEHCDKCFRWKSGLTKHRLSHSDIRP